MALTRRARRSNCSGRTSLRDALCGSRIWRDFLDGGFCQGIESDWSSEESDASSALSDLSLNDQPVPVHNNSGDQLCEVAAIP